MQKRGIYFFNKNAYNQGNYLPYKTVCEKELQVEEMKNFTKYPLIL